MPAARTREAAGSTSRARFTRATRPRQDVGACKRYYDDACLHGLATTTDPGAVDVQACVDAINNPATTAPS